MKLQESHNCHCGKHKENYGLLILTSFIFCHHVATEDIMMSEGKDNVKKGLEHLVVMYLNKRDCFVLFCKSAYILMSGSKSYSI